MFVEHSGDKVAAVQFSSFGEDEVGVKDLHIEYDVIGCRNMNIEEGDIQRPEAFEMWIWRRVMKISWTEHRSNQEVLHMVGETEVS